MPGRIEIDDVAPVVSCGTYPAKAVVGEVVPVSASVWREGHDAVAATLVVRYLGPPIPQIGQRPGPRVKALEGTEVADAERHRQPIKPQLSPMAPGRTPDVFHGQFVPDRVGLWTFRVDGWGDPITSWRHAVTAKLDAGQGETDLTTTCWWAPGCWNAPPPACRAMHRTPLLARRRRRCARRVTR